MPITIEVGNINKQRYNLSISSHPDICPLCHKHQEPIFITAFHMDKPYCQIVYRCTNNTCSTFFVSDFYIPDPRTSDIFMFYASKPQRLVSIDFEAEIQSLSSMFCEIYQEADFAEKSGYKQVAGCGYRKALEFLIKDYCITLYPDKAETIKSIWLMNVIKEYIDDEAIKRCAEKATYLGNDETHYIKKWEDMDMQDLKNLIDLTKYWMLNKIKTANYLKKFLNDGKK